MNRNLIIQKMLKKWKFREAGGSLIYLFTCTRPDFSFVVSKSSQHFAELTEQHWTTVKHAFRYFKGTAEQGLFFRRNYTEKLGLRVYSDADWVSDTKYRRSTSGYCVSLNERSSLISWKTRKQSTVALSTCEAEYMYLVWRYESEGFKNMCYGLRQIWQSLFNEAKAPYHLIALTHLQGSRFKVLYYLSHTQSYRV